MADDERLLELLARALDPGDVQPPAERVEALRNQAAARREQESVAGAGPAPPPTALGSRRVGWLAAGLAVAAAAVVIALVAAPSLMGGRGDETSVASGPASNTRDAVARLRAALVSRDPLSVARADAELVRLARQLPPGERAAVEALAVQAHLEAIQFLREHPTPEVLAAVPPGRGAEPSPPTTVGDRSVPLPTTVATAEPAVPTTTAAPPPPTTVAPDPSVTITAVTATIEGTFAVQFTVSGFTPDRSRRPGSYAVRFSFDDGQEPEVWDGPSPWVFPTDDAIRFHQVCAVVVDARGAEQPGSGNCVPII